jgi:hypothetical protein
MCITPTVFRLNPDLDPFEGDLLRSQVIRPLEEELDLLVAQIHKLVSEDEHEQTDLTRPSSPQESKVSISKPQKRMSAVTIIQTQSTLATALAHHIPSIPTPGSVAPGLAGGGGGGGRPPSPPAVAPPVAAAPNPPGGNGRLEGKEPTVFTGDRGKVDEFMHELKLYQFLNGVTPLMQDPYQKVAHVLTFIQGTAVAKCVMECFVQFLPTFYYILHIT